MMTGRSAKALVLQIDYPGKETSFDFSGWIKGYGFAFILAIILANSPVGKKLHLFLKKHLQDKLLQARYLLILEYIPFVGSLAAHAIFKLVQQQPWEGIPYFISWVVLATLYLFSYRWMTVIGEIRREKKGTDGNN